jgi:hypothetical protein
MVSHSSPSSISNIFCLVIRWLQNESSHSDSIWIELDVSSEKTWRLENVEHLTPLIIMFWRIAWAKGRVNASHFEGRTLRNFDLLESSLLWIFPFIYASPIHPSKAPFTEFANLKQRTIMQPCRSRTWFHNSSEDLHGTAGWIILFRSGKFEWSRRYKVSDHLSGCEIPCAKVGTGQRRLFQIPNFRRDFRNRWENPTLYILYTIRLSCTPIWIEVCHILHVFAHFHPETVSHFSFFHLLAPSVRYNEDA